MSSAEAPLLEMDEWLRSRLAPAPLTTFAIPFELKNLATRHKLQWLPQDKLWAGRFHCGVPDKLKRYTLVAHSHAAVNCNRAGALKAVAATVTTRVEAASNV